MVKSTIPAFQSIQEEAEFWDSHDLTDYLDELEIIQAEYQPQRGETKTVMTIRVAPSLKQQIEAIARSYDIPASSLVRMWIVEKIRLLNMAER
ncbi:MAG: CopG family antitoxin [Chloroflexi bacterium]|nr:CopG family antitoxin [Chloroflexota bacterium]